MSKPNFKVDVGKRTEDEVQAAVESAFSPNFVFRSPRLDDGKEVTDVLVLFDDVCLVVQVKAQVAATSVHVPLPDEWAEKSLRRAGRQVRGAVRALREGRVRTVVNACRGSVPFDIRQFPYVYGVVVLDHDSEPYDPYDLVPSLRDIRAPVTVLSFRDFWNLNEMLSTPIDLINYLEHRPEVLIPTLTSLVHREAEVFGYYVERLEDVMEVRARGRGEPLPPGAATRYAQELRRVLYGEHPDADAGLLIDHMIERIHDVDPDLNAFEQVQPAGSLTSESAYIDIATELGKVPRVRRIALGAEFTRIARLAAETGEDCHKVTSSAGRSDCMVFVASPAGPAARRERAEYLLELTALAKAYHQVRLAIGVATEAGSQMGSSYEMVLLEWPPSEDEPARELGSQLFGAGRPLLMV